MKWWTRSTTRERIASHRRTRMPKQNEGTYDALPPKTRANCMSSSEAATCVRSQSRGKKGWIWVEWNNSRLVFVRRLRELMGDRHTRCSPATNQTPASVNRSVAPFGPSCAGAGVKFQHGSSTVRYGSGSFAARLSRFPQHRCAFSLYFRFKIQCCQKNFVHLRVFFKIFSF
jgi:hypothetical protein